MYLNRRNTNQIREILETLLKTKIGYYDQADIEKAIMTCRGCDKRTRQNWYNYMWKLEYLIQPRPGVFHLNLTKLAELELPVPRQIDPLQKRLTE